MHIHIVRPGDGWVLQRIADQWSENLPPICTMNTTPFSLADVNIWCNYALFDTAGNWQKTKCDIGYFTHREDGLLGAVFDRAANMMDWCVAMSHNTAKRILHDRVSIIPASPHLQFQKDEIVFGIVGRSYPRKRECWIEELEKIPGIRIIQTRGKLSFESLPSFYRRIDYLLVLSDNEGGPLPVIEALAMGVPVISPDVGWCWEYPVLPYTTLEGLKELIRKLVIPKDAPKTEASLLLEVVQRGMRYVEMRR